MSIAAAALADPVPATSAEPTHISCCLSETGEPAPMLCGKVEVVEDAWIDDEAPEKVCVVCTDLAELDVCPILGRCPYGADWGEP